MNVIVLTFFFLTCQIYFSADIETEMY